MGMSGWLSSVALTIFLQTIDLRLTNRAALVGKLNQTMKTKSILLLGCLLMSLAASCSTLPPPTTTKNVPQGGVMLEDFKLTGDLSGDVAVFTLTANARVDDAKGGTLELVNGAVALTGVDPRQRWKMVSGPDSFSAQFDRSGIYPVEVRFHTFVRKSNDWSQVNFRVAPSVLLPVVLRGLPASTEVQFTSAAKPERSGTNFVSHLPVDGTVQIAWRQARAGAEGKLFYSAEMVSQVGVSPGLMRQTALIIGKVMQGEMSRVAILLLGEGEVTRVQGDAVLSWSVEPGASAASRRLVVQFNQPQKDAFAILVQAQTALGAFPQTAEALRILPEGATRFAGSFRVVNEGAVRLEVMSANGLSQISPDQFPETSLFRASGSQRFAYRFSSADFALKIQADQIMPEVGVSQVITYNLGENELSADAEIELDVRDAPLRELLLNTPIGYAITKVTASGMSDYFTGEKPDKKGMELRLIYGQPVTGRQTIQLRLERNQSLGEANWTLPRIEVAKAKTVRGFIGVSADNGFRLTPESAAGLTEIATAFFPRQLPGIQSAFRLSEQDWRATLRVERMPQMVQADAFHLFSIGEGIAYGSSVMNYVISGAPVSAFRVELSDEYFNVEFTGKDIRNWEKTTNGFLVQLHTPVSGAFTLLATYERPFKAQGETLSFTGARPRDAQSESGHTIIISAYQFQVKAANVSAGLLELEPGEVPPEYRLFFDQPVLKAYRYTARPFDLKLALSPLTQGDSLAQVVDRMSLTTRISKEGQAITDVSYLLKSRGNPNFRITLPEGTALWAATVNGATVVPVKDGKSNLIPLPQHADPDTVLKVNLKLANTSPEAKRVTIAAPVVAAPVMLAEWRLSPDEKQKLIYQHGSLEPASQAPDISGFAQLAQMTQDQRREALPQRAATSLVCLVLAVLAWRWASGRNVYRFSFRHLLGTLLGALLVVAAALPLIQLADRTVRICAASSNELVFLAPVQVANSAMSVEVANLAVEDTVAGFVSQAWPLALVLIAWLLAVIRESGLARTAFFIAGWLVLAWAALRLPAGAQLFLGVIVAFVVLQVVIPSVKRLWRVPAKPKQDLPPEQPSDLPPPNEIPPLVTTLLVGLCLLGSASNGSAGTAPATNSKMAAPTQVAVPVSSLVAPEPFAESVTQQITVEDKFITGIAKIRWSANRGDILPLLFEPAVLTKINYSKSLRLERSPVGSRNSQQLIASAAGVFDIEVQYQLQVTKRESDSGFALPVAGGLVHLVTLTLANLDVDVFSPQAISVQRSATGSNTVATLTLTPTGSWVGWKPRSRDVKGEKSVFHAELAQLYVPSSGVVEGIHHVLIRPAQGQLSELIFNIPAGATITDVSDETSSLRTSSPASRASIVSLWRFDPDTRKLRVSLNPAQSRAFTLVIRSQVATGTLPIAQRVGLISVEGAASQIGLLGVATGSEVQLDDVTPDKLTVINLEDFPSGMTAQLAAQFPGLTVRRAFRHSDMTAAAVLKAAAVEPDVRVETQDTLSLGEDRALLASTATVTVTRAGIFRLSFVMPTGFDVESISGAALSHWTEMKSDAGRVITLNLTGKADGRLQFTLNLSGPGVKTASGWEVPKIIFREANKQRGTLLLAPEQGMRLQVAKREGVTQLDPQKSGIRQKGVLAFRVLETPWKLTLDIEQVDSWVQVMSLQHTTVNESQMKVAANLQYQIENAGLKSFRVLIPTNAEGVTFAGPHIADFLAVADTVTNGLQTWEIKLRRRVIGEYLLQVNYQVHLGENASAAVLRGVQAADVNLQRGFATMQPGGRIQLRVDDLPASLQPTEWQGIPRALQKDLPAQLASFAYRLVEPDFQLPLKFERHEAEKLLPARVNKITFTSVISDAGVMLTQAHLDILPGDKRLLSLKLPKNAKFWFAFVNQNGVWPWREKDEILIPLERQSRSDQAVPVEIYFSSEVGKAGGGALDLALLAPKFDLPLENLTWNVFLDDKWELKQWSGALQLQRENVVAGSVAMDLNGYLQSENTLQQQKKSQAEQMLAAGNKAWQAGDQQQARRAFQSAYGLSRNDAAFNEDARVQLNNLKVEQALVGLNVRQVTVANGSQSFNVGQGGANKVLDLKNNPDANYTKQDAQQIIDNNSADEKTAFTRLAERLIQQQDAAMANPAVIRANIPQQGRQLTFTRAVVVDPWANLDINLQTRAITDSSWILRLKLLGLTALVLGGLGMLVRWLMKPQTA